MSSSRHRAVYRRRRGDDLCYTPARVVLLNAAESKQRHIISQRIKKQEKKRRTHVETRGGALASKYLLAQIELAARWSGHQSANTLESLV